MVTELKNHAKTDLHLRCGSVRKRSTFFSSLLMTEPQLGFCSQSSYLWYLATRWQAQERLSVQAEPFLDSQLEMLERRLAKPSKDSE